MTRALLLALALALASVGLVSAQTSVVSMFIYDADPQPLDASIIGNDATATTYSVNCPPGTDSDDCGMGPGMTVITGPQTTMILDSPDEDFYYTCVCSLDGTTYAVCAETASGDGANFPGTSTTTLDADLELMPVTVTAGSATGVAATTAHATADAPTASSTDNQTQTPAVSTGTGTGTATAASASGASSADASTAGASATSSGRGSLATGDAARVLGGAAAAAAALVAAVL
ncbi:hypothetical protein BO70DRAFT_103877 [Aspergillus heteromorphus CBS 117.55]|uniref:GPI anchored protein n=1 Tax=Aspergillus heteromorphus CBS 117.55 TaxID=1448321 RepID=A0A317VMW8_9EURO|nr:uncharacterized protein BO70DRAFT_103877 [Aspergillus heteromorphus CBS 117.55]PWY74278.1 hypothetical protein BO70DRAFT_103877 [Aspergillus heteromorphus CBS 117.55]